MKKYLLILLICIIFPTTIMGETSTNSGCDYKREVELNKLASKISYERVYSKDKGTFNITLYNVISDLYLKYENELYYGDENNEVTIKDIQEGEYMNVVVYSSGSSCYSSLMTIYITIPYFNPFYDSDDCDGYDTILTVCSSQFLTYRIDAQILKDAIDNYNNKIYNEPEPVKQKDTSIINGVKEFISLWGMKIILVVVTVGLSVWYFQVKLRKVKHGI